MERDPKVVRARLRRAFEAVTAVLEEDDPGPLDGVLRRTLLEGPQAVADLASGLVSLAGTVVEMYAVERGWNPRDVLRFLATKGPLAGPE